MVKNKKIEHPILNLTTIHEEKTFESITYKKIAKNLEVYL